MATPIKTSKSHDRMLEKINLSGVSELLNIKQDIIKHNLFNSFDLHSDRSKYSFLAMEVLHKLFVENIHPETLSAELTNT